MKIYKKNNLVCVEFSKDQLLVSNDVDGVEIDSKIEIAGEINFIGNYYSKRKQRFQQIKSILSFIKVPKFLINILWFFMFLFYYPKPNENNQAGIRLNTACKVDSSMKLRRENRYNYE